jgi:hypothetical protein
MTCPGRYNPFLKPLHLCNSNDFTTEHYIAQTEFLIEHLDEIVERTKALVPGRAHGFKLQRKNETSLSKSESRDERHLEYALYDLHKHPKVFDAGQTLPKITHIPYYQFPLRANKEARERNKKPKTINKGWGLVDLLGCAYGTHMPAVIELKISKKQPETPLRMIVEGMAYGIAIREMWNQENNEEFRKAWGDKLGSGHDCGSKDIEAIDIIGLAPEPYWSNWESRAAVHIEGETTWNSVTSKLISKAKDSKLCIKLVSFDGGNAQTPPSNFQDITDEFCKPT